MEFNAKVCPAQKSLFREEYNVIVSKELLRLRKDDAEKVDNYWKTVIQTFPSLFRKPIMLNLDRYELGAGYSITEHSRIIDYAMFVAHGNRDLEPRSAGLSADAMQRIKPQSASSFTLTSDWYAIFGTRPSNVLAPNQVTNIPEGMLRVSNPNPFDFMEERLEKELLVPKGSVKKAAFTGTGYELDYDCVVSSFIILLDIPRTRIEEMQKERAALGAPSNLIFKDVTLGTLRDFLTEAHPGSPNIAALNFINWYYGSKELAKTAADLGIRGNVMGTMEEFCADSGIEITGAESLRRK